VNITVRLTRKNEEKQIEIKDKSKIEDVLNKLDLKPDTVIVMYKNQPLPIDEKLIDGQELTILQVSSGG